MTKDIKQLNDQNFQETIEKGVVLVDFYADWCGPCKTIAPVIEQLSTEYSGKATIAKVNVDEAQSTTAAFGVTSIPTILVFKDGQKVEQFVGVTVKSRLQEVLNKHL
jgi:thioredoxin 1